jgi:hypothetical protein
MIPPKQLEKSCENKYSPILREAADIADERGLQYGDCDENFDRIQYLLKDIFTLNLSKAEIAQVFVATKLAREGNRHKDDNIIDAINYLAMMLYFIQTNESKPSHL